MNENKQSSGSLHLVQKMEEAAHNNQGPHEAITYHLQITNQPFSNSHPTQKIDQLGNEHLSISTSSTHTLTKSQQLQISQNQLKEKLIQLFKRDKQKNHQICDYFMNDLGLVEHCENIKRLIQFIQQNQEDNVGKINKSGKNLTNKFMKRSQIDDSSPSTLASPKSSLMITSKLTIFPNNVNFIASIFSRDKVQILIQLHDTNHKIINFLNFLQISLKSFIFTNQKQWILMKDQIQRYLSKYQKNVEKIYELEQQENDANNENINGGYNEKLLKKKLTQKSNDQTKLQKTKQIKKITSQMKKKYSQKFTLQNYKSQTGKVRKKLTEHQQSMCAALRKSFYAIYQRFEHMVEQLKDEMIFVIGLINKTESFNQSKEKYLIKQFLLESRKIGVESLIYLELIYKNIVEKLEDTRRNIFCQIEQSLSNKKLADNGKKSEQLQKKQYQPKCKRQCSFLKEVERIFKKLQKTLMIKKRQQYHRSSINNFVCESKIVVEDENQSKSDSDSVQFVQQINRVQALPQNEKCQEQKGKTMVMQDNKQQEQLNQQSENEKFISSVICQKPLLQSQKVDGKNKQKETKCVVEKKKRIRKVTKIQDKKLPQKKIQSQNPIQKTKIEAKIIIPKPNIRKIQQTLPPIDSQDQPNQSSSLQFLSQTLKQNKQQILSPKIERKQDLNKNSIHFSSMKKQKPNHYEDFQSLSIDIPLCLQYEEGSINMQDIDKEVSEQMSSFYNDVIENKLDLENREQN